MLRYGKILTKSALLNNKEIYVRSKGIISCHLNSTRENNIVFFISNNHIKNGYVKKFHTYSPYRSSTVSEDNEKLKSSKIKLEKVFNHTKIDDNEDIFKEVNDYNSSEWSHNNDNVALKEKYSFTDIERMYKNPKSNLHDMYQKVSSELGKNSIKFEFEQCKKKRNGWTCCIKVSWPEDSSFTASGNNKNLAGHAASVKVLHWLENNRRIKQGQPIIYSTSDVKNYMNQTVPLEISEESTENIKFIIEKYDTEIKYLMDKCETKSSENLSSLKPQDHSFEEGAVIDPVGKSNPVNRYPAKLAERNKILQGRYEDRLLSEDPSDLPIVEFREKILHEIENNQVVVIKGDTGCGKTTQVPQYIMDSFSKRGRATECNIIISQPRRISAISLAERVADERKEQVGDVVGYQVRLTQSLPNTPAGILFCTTGILLRKLQFNQNLEGCSHVIIDEAHERTINTDMLLALLKRTMKHNKDLKIIIMSATINAELFQNFFNSSVIQVPGRTYPVVDHFLEDIDKIGLRAPNYNCNMNFDDRRPVTSELLNESPVSVDIYKMAELVAWIHTRKPRGAILCFLPGWAEIVQMKKYLEEFSSLAHKRRDIFVVPLHSKMSNLDQKKIFEKPYNENIRKIVLSTDIAETGITVSDVVYVVDSCTHRQVKWHEKRGISSISNKWASQANVMQRKGRAGRVKPGESYHFITRDMFNNLDLYPIPEVKRSALEKTVLDGKTYGSNEKALDFLGSLPEPPASNVIAQAVDDLINLGALDYNENLTPLGKRIALFTLHPKLSKAILYSSIFNCTAPIITIASAMSVENNIFADVLQNKEAIRQVKKKYHPTSDHNGIGWLFEQWCSYNSCSRLEARDFCFKSRLYPERMFTLNKVRTLYADHLVHSRMIENLDDFNDHNAKINELSQLDELVRGVLLAGLDNIIHHRDFDIRKGQIKKGSDTFITDSGHRATITPESVNFKRKYWPSPYLTYVQSTHSEERRTLLIRETSILSPLTVFLFGQSQILGFLHEGQSQTNMADNNKESSSCILFTMKNKKNVKLLCNRESATMLLKFRDIMWSVIQFMVTHQGFVNADNHDFYEQVYTYKEQFLQVLAKLLSESAESIDNPPETQSKDDVEKY